MAKELAKWKQEFLDRLHKMTNAELLTVAFDENTPDDYDGCFTDRGRWRGNTSLVELYERLWTAGFIGEEAVKKMRDNIDND